MHILCIILFEARPIFQAQSTGRPARAVHLCHEAIILAKRHYYVQ